MLKMLENRHAVVRVFGEDRRGIADLCGLDDTHPVSGWMKRGFPRWTYTIIRPALNDLGYDAPAAFWNMPEPVQLRGPARKKGKRPFVGLKKANASRAEAAA